MATETLGARMKQYERMTEGVIPKGFPIAVRVDGCSFNKWTRGLDKPFDVSLRAALAATAYDLCRAIPEVAWAYLQSDEATFMLRSDLNHESDPWHGFRTKKLDSLVASMFTAHFARHAQDMLLYTRGNHKPVNRGPAFFDARAYPVPAGEVMNLLVWRQRDCGRNAIQAFGQHYLGKSVIHGWANSRVLEELRKIGKADLSYEDYYGTLVVPEYEQRGGFRPLRRWVVTQAFPLWYDSDQTELLRLAPSGHYEALLQRLKTNFGYVAPINAVRSGQTVAFNHDDVQAIIRKKDEA